MAARLLAVRGRSHTNSLQRMNNEGNSIILNIEGRYSRVLSFHRRYILLQQGLRKRGDTLILLFYQLIIISLHLNVGKKMDQSS